MRVKKTRKAEHNIGNHKEKMVKRHALRGLRVRIPYELGYHFKTGKYTPAVEDKKHIDNPV